MVGVTSSNDSNGRPARSPKKILIDPAIDAEYRAMTPPCTHCGSNKYTRFRYFNNKNAVLSRSENSKPQARFACRSPECLARFSEKTEVEFNLNGKTRQPYAKKNKNNTSSVSAAPQQETETAASSFSNCGRGKKRRAATSMASSSRSKKPTQEGKQQVLSYVNHAYYPYNVGQIGVPTYAATAMATTTCFPFFPHHCPCPAVAAASSTLPAPLGGKEADVVRNSTILVADDVKLDLLAAELDDEEDLEEQMEKLLQEEAKCAGTDDVDPFSELLLAMGTTDPKLVEEASLRGKEEDPSARGKEEGPSEGAAALVHEKLEGGSWQDELQALEEALRMDYDGAGNQDVLPWPGMSSLDDDDDHQTLQEEDLLQWWLSDN